MKPVFVSMAEGRRVVHWPKLVAFVVLTLLIVSALVEAVWYAFAGSFSLAALVFALVLATPIVVRAIVRAVTFQEQELEFADETSSS